MNAAASAGEERRMSRPTAMRFAPRYATKPEPMARAASSLTSPGYTPRTSYALKIDALIITLQPAVVGNLGFVAEHDVRDRRVPPDVAVATENGLADDGLLADARVGPDHRPLDRGVLFDMAVPAHDAVWANQGARFDDG